MNNNRLKQAKTIAEGIISYLKEEKIIYLVPEIIGQLKQLGSESANMVTVESAIDLSESERKNIAEIVHKKLVSEGEIKFIINPQILGGLKITLGDRVLDLSVKGKLKNIYEQI